MKNVQSLTGKKGLTALKPLLVTMGVVVGIVLTIGLARLVMADSGAKGKPAPGGAPAKGGGAPGMMFGGPVEVSAITTRPEHVTITTELPGRTAPFLVAEVRPQVSGIVQKRLFKEGADIKAGAMLYQIDDSVYQANVASAEANLAGSRKAADRARATLAAAQAGVKQAQATLELSKTNRGRAERLAKTGAVAVNERDRAVTEAQVDDAALKSAQAQVESGRQAVAEAETVIKQAEAALHAAKINLEHTQVLAPITGRIGKSSVTVGALAREYQENAFATIQQLDPIYVDVPRSTAELLRLKRSLEAGNLKQNGDIEHKVKIILDDNSEYPMEGTLQFSDITVDASTGSVSLRVIVPNPEGDLLPGMFVRVALNEGVNDQAILVPQQSVTRDVKGNPQVMLVDDAGLVDQRPVTVDRAMGDKWLIAQGLKGGEKVIVEGVQKVHAGDTVKVVPFADNQKEAASAAPKDQIKPATPVKQQ